jgi:hypothetical protein
VTPPAAAAPAPAAPSPSPAPQDTSPAMIPSIADGIDALSDTPVASAPAPKADATPAPDDKDPEAPKGDIKPPDAKPEPKAGDDDDLPSAPKPPEAAKPEDAKPEPDTSNWKGLRGAYAQSKETVAKLTGELATLKQQVEASKRAGMDEASAALKAEVESMRARVKEADERMRYYDYRSSPEFKEKFQVPLEKAWKEAIQEVAGFTYQDENGVDQKVTADTVAQLVNLPTMQASQLAQKIFGPAAPEVLNYRRQIISLDRAAKESETTWKAKGDELSQTEAREREKAMAGAAKMYDDHIAALRQTAPENFDRPTNVDEAKYFDKGAAWVDKAFKGKGIPDGLTPEQRRAEVIKAQATVATRAMAYGPLLHRYHGASAKIKDLETQLAAFKSSTPKSDGGKTESTTPREMTINEAIEALPSVG